MVFHCASKCCLLLCLASVALNLTSLLLSHVHRITQHCTQHIAHLHTTITLHLLRPTLIPQAVTYCTAVSLPVVSFCLFDAAALAASLRAFSIPHPSLHRSAATAHLLPLPRDADCGDGRERGGKTPPGACRAGAANQHSLPHSAATTPHSSSSQLTRSLTPAAAVRSSVSLWL